MTFISWFSDIGLYLEDYLMYKAGTLAGGIREPLLTCSSFLWVKTAVSRGFIGHNKSANFVWLRYPSSRRQNRKMFADESDEVCRLCYHLSSTLTERVGRITASDQTVRAVHSCISWFCHIYLVTIWKYFSKATPNPRANLKTDQGLRACLGEFRWIYRFWGLIW